MLMARRRAELIYGHIMAPASRANANAWRVEASSSSSAVSENLRQESVEDEENIPRPTGLPHRVISIPLHLLYNILEFMVDSRPLYLIATNVLTCS